MEPYRVMSKPLFPGTRYQIRLELSSESLAPTSFNLFDRSEQLITPINRDIVITTNARMIVA
jgi:hypothetical protein